MRFSPHIVAITFALVFCVPLISGGQGGLFQFNRDPQAAIIRKAKRYNLVSVEKEVPGARIDMKYKVTSASGRPLYLPDMPCLVHRLTAEKLKKANKTLNEHGYALKIWDAWRPPEAHQALWDAVKDPKYVVPPSKGLSWHCYGISVDLTLVDKNTGQEVAMPSKFDEFSHSAASDYKGGNPEIAKRVALLQKTMRDLGFRTIVSEWWHFDDMTAFGKVSHVRASDLGIKMP